MICACRATRASRHPGARNRQGQILRRDYQRIRLLSVMAVASTSCPSLGRSRWPSTRPHSGKGPAAHSRRPGHQDIRHDGPGRASPQVPWSAIRLATPTSPRRIDRSQSVPSPPRTKQHRVHADRRRYRSQAASPSAYPRAPTRHRLGAADPPGPARPQPMTYPRLTSTASISSLTDAESAHKCGPACGKSGRTAPALMLMLATLGRSRSPSG
jgi:hypothetical protein